MAKIEARLQTLGLVLPPPLQPPGGIVFPFQFVRVVSRRALTRPVNRCCYRGCRFVAGFLARSARCSVAGWAGARRFVNRVAFNATAMAASPLNRSRQRNSTSGVLLPLPTRRMPSGSMATV